MKFPHELLSRLDLTQQEKIFFQKHQNIDIEEILKNNKDKRMYSILVAIYIFFELVKKETLRIPKSISDTDKKQLYYQLFQFGLYKDILEQDFEEESDNIIDYILSVCIDRHLYKYESLKNRIECLDRKRGGKFGISKNISNYSHNIKIYLKDFDNDSAAHKTFIKTDPNKKLSWYIDKYIYLSQSEQLSDLELAFYKNRRPFPVLLQNHNWTKYSLDGRNDNFALLRNIAESSGLIGDVFFILLCSNSETRQRIFQHTSSASHIKLSRFYSQVELMNLYKSTKLPTFDSKALEISRSFLEIRAHNDVLGLSKRVTRGFKPAICISGQLRGADQCLPFWKDYSEGTNTPLFLSTWNEVGYPKGSEAGRLGRMIPSPYQNLVSGISDDEFSKVFPETFSRMIPDFDSFELLSKVFETTNLSEKYFILEDDDELEAKVKLSRGNVPRVHLNQIKMFYKMSSVLQKLQEYEQSENTKFSHVIWARPDIKVSSLHIEKCVLDDPDRVYTSRISDEGRMLDYLMVIPRDRITALIECYQLLINPQPSPIFGYNHGPRLITDMFLSRGAIPNELTSEQAKTDGLLSWRLNEITFLNSIKSEGVTRANIPPHLSNLSDLLS